MKESYRDEQISFNQLETEAEDCTYNCRWPLQGDYLDQIQDEHRR